MLNILLPVFVFVIMHVVGVIFVLTVGHLIYKLLIRGSYTDHRLLNRLSRQRESELDSCPFLSTGIISEPFSEEWLEEEGEPFTVDSIQVEHYVALPKVCFNSEGQWSIRRKNDATSR